MSLLSAFEKVQKEEKGDSSSFDRRRGETKGREMTSKTISQETKKQETSLEIYTDWGVRLELEGDAN
jgi:hypothetical protein